MLARMLVNLERSFLRRNRQQDAQAMRELQRLLNHHDA